MKQQHIVIGIDMLSFGEFESADPSVLIQQIPYQHRISRHCLEAVRRIAHDPSIKKVYLLNIPSHAYARFGELEYLFDFTIQEKLLRQLPVRFGGEVLKLTLDLHQTDSHEILLMQVADIVFAGEKSLLICSYDDAQFFEHNFSAEASEFYRDSLKQREFQSWIGRMFFRIKYKEKVYKTIKQIVYCRFKHAPKNKFEGPF